MKLYLVPTPIGNLEDITLRALRILRDEVDTILAEDTRTSGNLLKHYNISKRMQAFHLNNEHQQVGALAERIAAGERMALVTDAGTPAISDPGFLLVRECLRLGVEVECLPGATAFRRTRWSTPSTALTPAGGTSTAAPPATNGRTPTITT